MSSNTSWQSPSGPEDPGTQPAEPRFGSYGTPAAGQPAYGQGPQPQPYPAYPGAVPQGAPSFFVAPKPGIIPLRPLSITEIIAGAFESLRANPKAMFIPAIIVMAVIGVLSAVQTFFTTRDLYATLDAAAGDPYMTEDEAFDLVTQTLGSLSTSLVTSALTSLASIILTGLLIVAVSRSVLGRIATPGEVWERTKGRVWALIGQSLLVGLIVSAAALVIIAFGMIFGIGVIDGSGGSDGAVGLVLLLMLVLGISAGLLSVFLGIRLSLSTAALILENVGVIEGIKRSWRLTRGYFWRVLGTLLLAGLITAVATGVLSGITGVFTGFTAVFASEASRAAISAVSIFISTLVSALILPFSAAVTALIYIDLRMRQEGLDVELRQSAGM